MPIVEFMGGPWDGETKPIHEGDEIRIHMGSMPAMDVLSHPLSEPGPRIGVYKKMRRKGDKSLYYFWMGEK